MIYKKHEAGKLEAGEDVLAKLNEEAINQSQNELNQEKIETISEEQKEVPEIDLEDESNQEISEPFSEEVSDKLEKEDNAVEISNQSEIDEVHTICDGPKKPKRKKFWKKRFWKKRFWRRKKQPRPKIDTFRGLFASIPISSWF